MKLLRRLGLITAVGAGAGISATLLLFGLDWALSFRTANPLIIWALPLAGLGIGFIDHLWGQSAQAGSNLVIDEIHQPQKNIPVRMAPLILGGTIATHLFGGSAGREGTAIQMSSALAEALGQWIKVTAAERRMLLVTALGAGFGAAVGAPMAGMIFGMEVLYRRGLQKAYAFECLLASFTAYAVTHVLHAPHSTYARLDLPFFDFQQLAGVAAAGILFGLCARLFMATTHWTEFLFQRQIKYPPFRPMVGGLALAMLFHFEGTGRFLGLGIDQIQNAMLSSVGFDAAFLKTVFTALTLGSGFKGGEFIPLVFVGTTFGSALAAYIPVGVGLLSAVGFAAVFGAAAHVPLACTLMAMEIFGYSIGAYALTGCLIAHWVAGRQRIYRTQRT